MTDHTKYRNYIYNIILSILSVLVVCVILEIVLRSIGYNPFKEFLYEDGRELFLTPSKVSERIYEAAPNTKGYGWNTDVEINSYGFRDKEYSIKKEKGVYRIIAIGDSITFGNNLPVEATYPKRLEQLFKQGNKQIDVLNMGLGGYDTLQEVATLEDIGIQFQPDLVIVGYCINDIGSTGGNLDYIKSLQKYGSPIYKIRLAQFLKIQIEKIRITLYVKKANKEEVFARTNKDYILDTSQDKKLNKFMNKLAKKLKAKSSVPMFTKFYASHVYIGKLRYSFEQLKKLKDKHKFQVIVAMIPYLLENETDKDIHQTIYEIIKYESGRAGFDVLNLYNAFGSKGFNNFLLDENDGTHPNNYGHELIADRLNEYISSKIIAF